MNNPRETINKIEEFWRYPKSKNINLLKAKHSKKSKTGRIINKGYVRLRKIKPLVALKRKLEKFIKIQ